MRCLAAVLVVGGACGVGPPAPKVPGWDQPGAAIEAEERTSWAAAEQRLASLEAHGAMVGDARLAAYLDGVLQRLQPATLPAGVPAPRVRTVRALNRQAYSSPNGVILVTSGYLAALDDESELAALLAHELAHFLDRHSLITKRYARISTSTVERMHLSRALEEAADRKGLDLMRRAGYDPHAAIDTLALIEKDDLERRVLVPEWESHPDIPARMKALRREVGHDGATDAAPGRARYEEAIVDMLPDVAARELEAQQLARARATIERYVRLRPASGHGQYLLAEYARLTEPDGRRSTTARRGYERAVELSPDDPDTVRALALLSRDDGDHERARTLFATYLRVAPDAPDRKLIERYLREPASGTPPPAAR